MFVFRRKTEYWVRISDWSSDVCSSDLEVRHNLLFNAGLSWRQTDYRGTSDQTQRIWGGNVEADYLLNRHLSIAAMGWYKHRNSYAPDEAYELFRAGLVLRFNFCSFGLLKSRIRPTSYVVISPCSSFFSSFSVVFSFFFSLLFFLFFFLFFFFS